MLWLEEWKMETGAMPKLKSLIVNPCAYLRKFPEELWRIKALHKLESWWPRPELRQSLHKFEEIDRLDMHIYPIGIWLALTQIWGKFVHLFQNFNLYWSNKFKCYIFLSFNRFFWYKIFNALLFCFPRLQPNSRRHRDVTNCSRVRILADIQNCSCSVFIVNKFLRCRRILEISFWVVPLGVLLVHSITILSLF